MNQIIQSRIIQQKYSQQHSREEIELLKEQIQQMCDSNEQSDLLSDFAILLNHQNREYLANSSLRSRKESKNLVRNKGMYLINCRLFCSVLLFAPWLCREILKLEGWEIWAQYESHWKEIDEVECFYLIQSTNSLYWNFTD